MEIRRILRGNKRKMKKKKSKLGQIWVETVLYTLIGLAIIGILLAVARPEIAKKQDEVVIEQTIKALNDLDNKIIEVKRAVGNRRTVEFQLSRGELSINSKAISSEIDEINWTLRGTRVLYSEPGQEADLGRLKVLTRDRGGTYDVTLRLTYENTNLLIDGEDNTGAGGKNRLKILQQAKTPYNLIVENVGYTEDKVNIDISIS